MISGAGFGAATLKSCFVSQNLPIVTVKRSGGIEDGLRICDEFGWRTLSPSCMTGHMGNS